MTTRGVLPPLNVDYLTRRERQCVELAAPPSSLGNAEIARVLGVTYKTAAMYIWNARQKMRDRQDAARMKEMLDGAPDRRPESARRRF